MRGKYVNTTVKKNLPMAGMIAFIALFSSACTVGEILDIIKIIGLFL